MRRAAISRNALELPAQPAVRLEIVRGRQQAVRHGIFFAVVGKHRRSVYMQLNGETILADECKCLVEYPDKFFPDDCCQGVGFVVLRNADCPIDEHRLLQEMQSEEDDL